MGEKKTHQRDKVGALSLKLVEKEPDTRDPIEIQREVHKKYVDEIELCLNRGKKAIVGDFFIVVATKKEKLMPNVLRNYFGYRKSCPTPTWDQTVYHYRAADDVIEFLWVIPSRDTCELFQENVLHIADEEKELLKYILDFEDGTLLKKAKQLNNEI